jgi:hypothetical protein
MKRTRVIILAFTLAAAAAGLAFAQAAHPLSRAGEGDWAKYSVTVDNSTTPFLSVKDQQRWRAVSGVSEAGVRIDNYTFMLGQRMTMGPSWIEFGKPFEPVFEISSGAKIEVVSSGPESLTVSGKTYACTKTVRKVSRATNAETLQTGWNGTSTVWTCPDVPVGGVVKIENQCETQLTPDSKPDKVKETWTLAEFGFKSWKED